MDVEKELTALLRYERDNPEYRMSYNREIDFYDTVASGDLEKLEELYNNITQTRFGILSASSLTSNKYHGVILTALLSRFCIEKGLDITVSYSLSDIYINRIDMAKTEKEVDEIKRALTFDYCRRMRNIVKTGVVSRHVVMAIEYIRNHIQDNLTVEAIADALGLNVSYLSKLFKQETNKTLSHYIRDMKIDIAKNMLRHLDESSLAIANYLGFSSQSHFIQVFKKETGMTPEEYRKKNYHQTWMNREEDD